MMGESRKATADDAPPLLELYALAQVHADQVKAECLPRCKDCPGPDAPDGCNGRPFRRSFLKRADWPRCQLGMLTEPAWQGIVSVFRQAQVAAPRGWPDAYPAFVVAGVTELKLAVAKDMEERSKAARKAASSDGGPIFTGLSSKDGPT